MASASMHWNRATSLAIAAVLATGCASRSLYSEVGEDFSSGYEAAGNIIGDSLSTAIRDTRRLAVIHYIQSGDSDFNLNSSDIDGSFRRFVCAGTGLYPNQHKALEVLGAYRRIIADLSSEPSDEIGALWSSINRLRQPQGPLKFEEAEPNAFQSCLQTLEAPIVPPKGEPIEAIDREAPPVFAAYNSFSALVDAVKALAVKSLQQIDEAARAKAIKQFVLENQDTVARFIGTINEDGSYNEGEIKDEVLKKALDVRRRSTLVVPYYEFTRLFSLSRSNEAADIVLQGEAVHLELDEFDTLRTIPDPRNVVRAMRQGQAELIRLANGDLSASEGWGVFRAFADALGELNEAVTGVGDAADAL